MPPLTFISSHVQAESQQRAFREWTEALAEAHRVIRYDSRGAGLSASEVSDYSFEAMCEDIDAVADALGLPEFALFAGLMSGGLGIGYAATRPERVSALVLWCATLGGEAIANSRHAAARNALDAIDPELAFEIFVRAGVGIGEDAQGVVSFLQQHVRPGPAAAFGEAFGSPFDVTMHAAQVTAPTLVLNPSNAPFYPQSWARDIAAAIPKATLSIVQTDSQSPLLSAAPEVVKRTTEFLSSRATTSGSPGGVGGFQTILFTDLEASTPLTQRLGDEGAQEILRGHNATVRGALDQHGGREVKHTGDGIMASFPSAVAAVTAALQIQRELAGGEVRVRVGLNAGEPIAEDDDLFGTSVILAARVTDRAEPGQVLVTRVVADLCAGKQLDFRSLGDVTLKGFDEAVELFEVAG